MRKINFNYYSKTKKIPALARGYFMLSLKEVQLLLGAFALFALFPNAGELRPAVVFPDRGQADGIVEAITGKAEEQAIGQTAEEAGGADEDAFSGAKNETEDRNSGAAHESFFGHFSGAGDHVIDAAGPSFVDLEPDVVSGLGFGLAGLAGLAAVHENVTAAGAAARGAGGFGASTTRDDIERAGFALLFLDALVVNSDLRSTAGAVVALQFGFSERNANKSDQN